MHQVHGDSVSHKTTIFKWIKRFKEGQDDLKDDPKEGRPSTSTSEENVKAVQDLVEKDRRNTIDKITTTLEVLHGSAFSILADHLGLSKLYARWASKALREDQLVQRAKLSMSLSSKIEAIDNDCMEQTILTRHGFTNTILRAKYNQCSSFQRAQQDQSNSSLKDIFKK